MPQTITPAGIELNPTTEHIEEPYSDKVKEILERKGVKYKNFFGPQWLRNIKELAQEFDVIDHLS